MYIRMKDNESIQACFDRSSTNQTVMSQVESSAPPSASRSDELWLLNNGCSLFRQTLPRSVFPLSPPALHLRDEPRPPAADLPNEACLKCAE